MAFAAAMSGSKNTHLAGEECDLYDEEETNSRRGSRSSGGSSPGSTRRHATSNPSPLWSSDDAKTKLELAKAEEIAGRKDANGRKHQAIGQTNLMSREKTPDNMVRMILCGREFQVLATTLHNSGSNVLQKLEPKEDCEFFMPDMSKRLGQQCYHFGSRPSAFEAIIMFMETGKLHPPTDMSVDAWLEEVFFYQIKGMDAALKSQGNDDTEDSAEKLKKALEKKRKKKTRDEMTAWDKSKAIMWAITDGEGNNPADPDPEDDDDEDEPFVAPPYTSECWTYFSMTILLASVVLLCVETLPQYREKTQQDCFFENNTAFPECASWFNDKRNRANVPNFTNLAHTNCTCEESLVEYADSNIYITEAIFVIWFTIELVLRFFVCPDKVVFLKGLLNIIDVLAILPFYIALGAPDAGGGLDSIRILRLFRVFRIFKLSRHSAGLQIFAMALYRSRSILGQLFIFVMTVSILFSAMIFYCEYKNTDSDYGYFSSIPQSLWWAIVTMTTLGYGDMVPQTALGQVVGSACALSGILVVSLPIPVFVENFQRLWNAQYSKKKHGKHIQDAKASLAKEQSQKLQRDVHDDDPSALLKPKSMPPNDIVADVNSTSSVVVRVESEVVPPPAVEAASGTIKADQVSVETTV